jgi:hypothetical protein
MKNRLNRQSLQGHNFLMLRAFLICMEMSESGVMIILVLTRKEYRPFETFIRYEKSLSGRGVYSNRGGQFGRSALC